MVSRSFFCVSIPGRGQRGKRDVFGIFVKCPLPFIVGYLPWPLLCRIYQHKSKVGVNKLTFSKNIGFIQEDKLSQSCFVYQQATLKSMSKAEILQINKCL